MSLVRIRCFILLECCRALSLDVVCGAVLSSYVAGKFLSAHLPLLWLPLLASTVWTIYTFDHTLDAWAAPRDTLMPRHAIHRTYQNLFLVLLVGVGGAAFVSAFFFLDSDLLFYGIMLSAFVGAYLLCTHCTSFTIGSMCMKEPSVAALYTLGVWGGPTLRSGRSFTQIDGLAILCFFLLALSNLYLFSYFEKEYDMQRGVTSTGTALSSERIESSLVLISSASFLSAGGLLLYPRTNTVVIGCMFFVMSSVLAALLIRPAWFQKNCLYRVVADGIFVVPPLFVAILLW